jgi:hypothetical protein
VYINKKRQTHNEFPWTSDTPQAYSDCGGPSNDCSQDTCCGCAGEDCTAQGKVCRPPDGLTDPACEDYACRSETPDAGN